MTHLPILAAGLGGLSLALLGTVSMRALQEDDAPRPEARRWRVLVTNDDGIGTGALAELVAALAEQHEVVVCAPDGNRSGSSQSLRALGEPMSVREASVAGASRAVAVGGTPADAVSYGLLELGKEKPFDLVVSGINEGPNVGDLSHSSGTVGAAMEAVYRGVPAIAVSQGMPFTGFSFTARFAAEFAAELRRRGAPRGVVYSINVPTGKAEDLKGVAARPMGGALLEIHGWTKSATEDGGEEVRARIAWGREAPEGSDMAAFFEGYVTVTPLQFDWTDRAALADLGSWSLTVE